MFLTVHTAAAVAISQQVASPWLVFLLALLSHLILDFIPHGDEDLLDQTSSLKPQLKRIIKVILIDLTITIIFSVWYFNSTAWQGWRLFIAAILGAFLPDLMTGTKVLLKEYFNKSFYFIEKFQAVHQGVHHCIRNNFNFTMPFLIGMALQISLFIIFVTLI